MLTPCLLSSSAKLTLLHIYVKCIYCLRIKFELYLICKKKSSDFSRALEREIVSAK
jgi:hypothetical protein